MIKATSKKMFKLTTNFLVVLIALFALSVINLITVFTYQQIQELEEANAWVAHTHEVIETSDSMFKNVLLMGSAGRAFLFTGQQEYVLDFNNYSNQAFNDLTLLKQLTINNFEQRARISEFESNLKNRTSALTNIINIKQKKAFDDKILISETHESLKFIAKLNEAHNTINEAERKLLEVRGALVHEHSKNVVFFTMLGDAVSILILVGGLIIIIYQLKLRSQVEDKLQHLAYHDMLTGLANRSYLESRIIETIQVCQRHSEKMALIFVDIDKFKSINDRFGHDAGDFVLQTLATRLLAHVRSIDTVCRLGGDEFIIILAGIREKSDIETAMHKIFEIMNAEIIYKKNHFSVKVSVGISMYPDDGKDARTLMKNSDIAMYQAKEKGGNNYHYYKHPNSSHHHPSQQKPSNTK